MCPSNSSNFPNFSKLTLMRDIRNNSSGRPNYRFKLISRVYKQTNGYSTRSTVLTKVQMYINAHPGTSSTCSNACLRICGKQESSVCMRPLRKGFMNGHRDCKGVAKSGIGLESFPPPLPPKGVSQHFNAGGVYLCKRVRI